MKQPLIRGLVVLVLFLAVHATRHDGETAAAELTPEAGGGLQPLITTSELVVGQNRFAFGLLKAHKLLERADVTVRASRGLKPTSWRRLMRPINPLRAASMGSVCIAIRMGHGMCTAPIRMCGGST